MTRTFLVVALFTLALRVGAASAEPRLAIREGLRCGHCHVNQTGGGMRTPYGVSFAQTGLPTFRLPAPFSPELGEHVAMGANLRLSHLTTLPAETELDGVTRRSEATDSFDMGEANLYVRADIVPDRLTVYVDETVGPEGASAREAFVLVGIPGGLWLKAGRFLLAYGLRLPDDRIFVRQETGFTYANQDLGFELGWTGGPFTTALAVTNGSLGGSDPDLLKQVTFTTELVGRWIRGGASFAWNRTTGGDGVLDTFTFGGHVGLRLGRLVTLAELDWVRGSSDAETYDQWSLYTEADFEATKGLHLRFAFGANDPLLSMDNNERDRFVAGVSWFPIQMLEVRAEYRLERDIPQRVQENADQIFIELHGFL